LLLFDRQVHCARRNGPRARKGLLECGFCPDKLAERFNVSGFEFRQGTAQQGGPVRTVHYVAAQLGHSPALTLSTYGHLIAEYADAGQIDAEQEIATARAGGNPMAGGDRTLGVVVCGS